MARATYEHTLRRALERHFPGFTIPRLTTGGDIEKSFGPISARGLLRQGQSGFAVLGVNAQETQASIDAALTFGILWLDVCRTSQQAKILVDGLTLLFPGEAPPWPANGWRILTRTLPTGACLSWTNGTTRWWKSTVLTGAMWQSGWSTLPMKVRSRSLRGIDRQNAEASASLRSCRTFACGEVVDRSSCPRSRR
jgi:hypothetical protein